MAPTIVTRAQDKATAFSGRYELIYQHRAEGPKEAICQTDHTLLDEMVLDANGQAVGLCLTLMMDDG